MVLDGGDLKFNSLPFPIFSQFKMDTKIIYAPNMDAQRENLTGNRSAHSHQDSDVYWNLVPNVHKPRYHGQGPT